MEPTKKLSKTLLGAGLALALGFALAGGNPAAAQTCVAPSPDLIGWWDADSVDGTTATDIKGGNDGTMLGSVTIVPGKVGDAFSFDGINYQRIQLPFGSDVFTGQFTVDAWARPEKTTTHAYFQAILEDDDAMHAEVGRGIGLGFYGGIGFWWAPPGGVLEWYPNPFQAIAYINMTPIDPNPGAQFTATANATPGEMHHYASTYDGAELCLYIDGVQEACTATSGDLNDNGKDFLIAGNQEIPESQRYFQGEIDEVEIFDRALTAAEIQAIFNAGSAGKCKTIEADINIKAGSFPNSINTCSKGTTPVTIWGSETFDVTTVNVSQTTLASALVKTVGKSSKILCSIGDVGSFDDDGGDNLGATDGFDDLTCHFVTFDLDVVDESPTAELNIVGCDDPTIVGGTETCEAGDSGFYDIISTDTVNIVKDCDPS